MYVYKMYGIIAALGKLEFCICNPTTYFGLHLRVLGPRDVKLPGPVAPGARVSKLE